MKRIALFTLASMLVLCSCACENKAVPEKPEDKEETQDPVETVEGATVFTTTFDKSQDFAKARVAFGKASTMSPNVVRLTDERFQSIDGFGLAITQASCYNLLKMSTNDRSALLKELFSPTEGAGSSLIRVCIGGSDFSMDEYTWCDTKGMEHFAIHPSEEQYLFPILDEIYRINPDVRIIGSPWSCPRWMKMKVDSGAAFDSWTSGRLNPVYYADYAAYFVKWIQAMEQRGYKIMGVTLQNEPLNHGNSMSLYMPWDDQMEFLKVVGPAFEAAGLSQVKIMLFDHNYNYDNQEDQRRYPLKVYSDPVAARYAAGSAWHNYGGSVSELDAIHTAAPDKGIWFTEASIGEWNYKSHGFGGQFQEDFREIVMGTLKRYGKGITLWNMMLDDEGKPYRPGGCSTCYGAVSVSHSTYALSSVDRKSHWYDVLHTSAVIKPGAVRVGTKGYTASGVTYLAFSNPDASTGVIFLNESSQDQQFVFASSERSVSVKVPAKSVVSAIWKE